MNSFTSEWLALREPVDHRSRNHILLASVVDQMQLLESSRPGAIHVVDLGCGSGSNLRALGPVLSEVQKWTLVDSDPQLLHAAQATLLKWSDASSIHHHGGPVSDQQVLIDQLILKKNNKKITVNFLCADLSQLVHLPIMASADLVTAAAFFDLTSQSWLEQFCASLSKPLYATLSYNGSETWEPIGPLDSAVLQAFHAHQNTDKGFGAAAGPSAANLLIHLLTNRGFKIQVADSPWVLNAHDRPLIDQLASGTASAVIETGLLSNESVKHWLRSKLVANTCVVGHTDVFACP